MARERRNSMLWIISPVPDRSIQTGSISVMTRKKIDSTWLVVIAPAAILFSLLLWCTPNGLGVSPDSVSYLKGARGLLNERSFDFISSQWPPLYPVLIAVVSKVLNTDVLLGSRVLSAFFYALTYLLTLAVLVECFQVKRLAASIISLVVCAQVPITHIYFYAWSEPCLINCLLLNFLALSRYAQASDDRKLGWFFALFLISTAALMTRFAGVSVVVLNAVALLLIGAPGRVFHRLLFSTTQLVLPMLIFVLWLHHHAVTDGSATDRTVEFHLITLSRLVEGLVTIGKWFFPYTFPDYLLGDLSHVFVLIGSAVILLLSVSSLSLLIKFAKDWRYQISSLDILTGFSVCYLMFLVTAISFVDNKISLDNRILLPFFITCMLAVVGWANGLSCLKQRILLLAVLLYCVVPASADLRAWLLLNRYGGVEMASKSHQNQALYQFLRACQKNVIVYADEPWNIDLYFDNKVFWLPSTTLFNTGHLNAQYEKEFEGLETNADLIVVEKASQALNRLFDSSSFRLIYLKNNQAIFQNSRRVDALCNVD